MINFSIYKRFSIQSVFCFLISLITSYSFAQTGPAGIGNATGASGQPENILWLDAATIGLGNNTEVTTWNDLSGNGNDFTKEATEAGPTFRTDGLFSGTNEVVRFDGTERYLTLADNVDLDDNAAGITIITVIKFNSFSGARGILSKRNGAGNQDTYSLFAFTGNDLFFDVNTSTGNTRSRSNASLTTANDMIVSVDYNGANQSIYLQTAEEGSVAKTGLITDRTSPLVMGALNLNYGTYLDADIAEVIMFKGAISSAQRVIIENYLSQKYNITAGVTNDFFGTAAAYNTSFFNDFRGIGLGSDNIKQSTSGFSSALQVEEANNSLEATDEYVMLAHDNTTFNDVVSNITVSADLSSRWERSWFVQAEGAVGIKLRFDFGLAGKGVPTTSSDYVLLYRPNTTADFTRVPVNSYAIENTNQLVVNFSNADISTGYFTLGNGTPITPGEIYSYKSGNWNDPTTWTTDPSGNDQIPVGGLLPTSSDNITIYDDVTMTTDNNDGLDLNVDGGTLIIAATQGHDYVNILGNGTISISGNAGVDNFPTGATTAFADSISGGTLLIRGTGISLNNDRLLNNVTINLSSAANIATLEADYTINGDLTITRGIFQINDNVTANARSITTYGDVFVEAPAEINVGTANARHEFNFYGDFSNNGRVEFTNRATTNYGTEATNGIVDANFLNGTKNQTIDCNGVTNFYRIEIDKGSSQNYILDINASSAANFNLFGPADYGHGSVAQLTTNDNALGLLRGTVRLNANVNVPVLNNGGNYNISEAARLWVNGGYAEKPSGTAIVPYGTIQLSGGILNAPINSGITTRANGNIVVSDGVMTVNQIRTSVNGPENIGGYTQSGGTVNITGNNISTQYYAFSLTYPGNTFNMSAGTLRVAGAPTGANTGGIFIASDAGNQNVTGGTVIMEINRNNEFKLASEAPFGNVIMRKTSGSGTDVDLITGASGAGGNITNITNPDLIVLNNLTIETGVTFDHNGNDVTIGSDFTIEAGADYVYDGGKPNTTSFIGSDNATLTFLNITGGANDEQQFFNFIMDRPSGKTLTLVSGKADLTGNENNLLRIEGDAFKVLSGTLDQGFHSIRMYADTVVNYDQLTVFDPAASNDTDANGENDLFKLRDDGLAATVFITADTSRFGGIKLNSGSEIINLISDVKIDYLEYRHGRMNLGVNNLTIDVLNVRLTNEAAGPNGNGEFSVEDMFITAGNASDGGLSLKVNADGTNPGFINNNEGNTNSNPRVFSFPVGTGSTGDEATSEFTPGNIRLLSATDDGYMTVIPVTKKLATAGPYPLGNDIADRYWIIDYRDFTTEPTVERLRFRAVEKDDPNGGADGFPGPYVPGYVLSDNPFTRTAEVNSGANSSSNIDNVNATDIRIFFWGNTGSGNPAGGFSLKRAEYTAGDASKFVGAPTIYYSTTAGNGNDTNFGNGDQWDQSSRWSTVGHYSTTNTGSIPQGGDIAILGFGLANATATTDNGQRSHWFFVDQDTEAAKLIFADQVINANGVSVPRTTSFQPQLIINDDNNLDVTFGTVEGNGAFNAELSCTSCNIDPSISNTVAANISGDFGAFAANSSSRFDFDLYSGNNSSIFVPATFPLIYPNVHLKGQGGNGRRIVFQSDITINRSLVIREGAYLSMSTTANGNISVGTNLNMTINNDGDVIEFPNSGPGRTLTINGNINMDNAGDLIIVQDNNSAANVVIHRLRVGGDIVQDAGRIDLYSSTGANRDQVILEVFGNTNGTFTSTNRELELYRLVVNKGTNKNTTFTFNDDVSLNGTSNGTLKALELLSGTVILNDANIDINLTTGGDNFAISNRTAFQVTQGIARVSGTNSGIYLDGCLIIDGGTLDMDDAVGNGNNFIEYSASGNALIEISDGVLDVGSQIRPITTANTGVLRYRQTGGDVRIGTQAAPESTRGMLQIYNVGSEFTYTAGTLTILRHQTAPTVAALYLDPDVSDVTGSTISIFDAGTPASQNNFRINSFIPLNNLAINGVNNPTAILDVNPLTIEGDLNIATNATLDGSNLTLTVSGDMVNDGVYDGLSNETIFNSTSAQQLTGSGTNDFFRFTKEEVGELDLTNSITVNGLFKIFDGTLNDNGNNINLLDNAVIDGIHTSNGGNGLVFNGGLNQTIGRSQAGTGTVGFLTIDNPNGLLIPTNDGYNFFIEDGLQMNGGVFEVGGNDLTLGPDALITGTFSVNNMIKTNSSFSDRGVTKFFPTDYTGNFVFPIGEGFYTPVSFDFSVAGGAVGSTEGSISVRTANEFHPTVNDGGPDDYANDINNVLQYYWTLRSSNINGLTADVVFNYNQSDVLTEDGAVTENTYIPARIRAFDNASNAINKFTTSTTTVVNPAGNTITFSSDDVFNGVSSDFIDGDYFAGDEQAIPDLVVTYVTGSDGDVNAQSTYTGGSPSLPGGTNPPSGAVLVVSAGTEVTFNVDRVRLYKTVIEAGGTLNIDGDFDGHRLGILEGTGILKITSNTNNATLPLADYGTFFSCSGGGLEYAGTGNYNILTGYTSIRNLILSDPTATGVRNFPSNNLTICEDLIVDGPVVNNANNRTIDVQGNTFINSGTFNGGTGTINFRGDLEVSGGTYDGQNGGQTNIYGKFLLNSGTFNSGTAGSVIFRGDIERIGGAFVSGNGTTSNQIRGTSLQTITGDFTGSNSFSRLNLRNSSGFIKVGGDMEASGSRLDFQDGILNMNGFDFEITANTVLPNGGRSNSYIAGKVLREISSSFSFPIGSISLYRPALVRSVSTGSLTWEAQFFNNDVVANTIATTGDPTDPAAIVRLQLGEYWIISDGNAAPSGVTANVGLSWGIETDVSANPTERQELQVMVWNAGSDSWDELGGGGFSGGNTQSQGSFESTATASFSENIFIIGSGDVSNPLPVELISFTAKIQNNAVQLDWVTATEKDNDFFEVQRSFDGQTFETIGIVEGNGTVSYEVEYGFRDVYPLNGRSYYRLKQNDYDGNFEFSPIVTVVMEVASNLRLFPNPTTDQAIYLTLDGFHQSQDVYVKIFNLQGRNVYEEVLSPEDLYRKPLPIKEALNPGIYIVEVNQGNTMKQVRLAIQ